MLLMLSSPGRANIDRAWQLSQELETLTPESARDFYGHYGQILAGGVVARAGLPDSARRVLDRARVGLEGDPDRELAGYEAVMRTLLGDHDEAIRLLKIYVAANPDHLFNPDGEVHWWWRDLRDHSDFQSILGGH